MSVLTKPYKIQSSKVQRKTTALQDQSLINVLEFAISQLIKSCLVVGGFPPKQVRTHIDSTSNQVVKIDLSLTEQK